MWQLMETWLGRVLSSHLHLDALSIVFLFLVYLLSELPTIYLQNFMAEAASATQDHMGGSINQGYNSYPTNAPVYASPPSSATGHTGHPPSADYGPVYGTNYGY